MKEGLEYGIDFGVGLFGWVVGVEDVVGGGGG